MRSHRRRPHINCLFQICSPPLQSTRPNGQRIAPRISGRDIAAADQRAAAWPPPWLGIRGRRLLDAHCPGCFFGGRQGGAIVRVLVAVGGHFPDIPVVSPLQPPTGAGRAGCRPGHRGDGSTPPLERGGIRTSTGSFAARPHASVPHEAIMYLAAVLTRYHRFDDAIAVHNYLLDHEFILNLLVFPCGLGGQWPCCVKIIFSMQTAPSPIFGVRPRAQFGRSGFAGNLSRCEDRTSARRDSHLRRQIADFARAVGPSYGRCLFVGGAGI